MEGGIVYEDSHHMTNVLMKNESSEVLDSLWVPNSSPSFHGTTTSMVNFEDVRGVNNTDTPFFTQIDPKSENLNNDEMDNGCFHQPEKKRRLLPEQVQFLEKSFEVENKLEPERKVQLAKELGLQPRQVAIWFQNRRARYKTKHLEKEYDALKASYDNLKTDYDSLFEDNEKLKNEILSLTEKLLAREDEKLEDPSNLPRKKQKLSLDDEKIVTCKLEGVASSAKSDILDSDSPQYYTEGNHSALLEPADSSHAFEPEASDFSQDEDNNSIGRNFLQPTCFPKVELETFDDLQPNSCNLGFPVQDQGTWFWQY